MNRSTLLEHLFPALLATRFFLNLSDLAPILGPETPNLQVGESIPGYLKSFSEANFELFKAFLVASVC